MYTTNNITKIAPPKTFSATSHPVNLVNPVHLPSAPSSASRSTTFLHPARKPAPKPNRSGAPLQTKVFDRTKSQSSSDQKRTEPGSKVENFSQPIENALPQIPKTKKLGEPTEPAGSPSCTIDRIT